MPHRPVVKEARLTTKVRPVFDASATGYNGVSLNSCMNTGPNLLANLYVNDLLSGTDSDKEGCEFIREASSVMSQASLPLVKWVSNNEVILKSYIGNSKTSMSVLRSSRC